MGAYAFAGVTVKAIAVFKAWLSSVQPRINIPCFRRTVCDVFDIRVQWIDQKIEFSRHHGTGHPQHTGAQLMQPITTHQF